MSASVPSSPELVAPAERTLETIMSLYSERIGPTNENIIYRLAEYKERISSQRPSDWFAWMHKGIMSVATKTRTEQRTIAYLLGIYKAWLTHGFGNCRASEMDKIRSFAEDRAHVRFSEAAMHKLDDLVTRFGIVSVMSSLAVPTSPADDPSLAFMERIESNLTENERERGAHYGG